MTKLDRHNIALALFEARPITLPGTNVIVNATERSVWHGCVTELSQVCCVTDKEYAEFFDTAGVAD